MKSELDVSIDNLSSLMGKYSFSQLYVLRMLSKHVDKGLFKKFLKDEVEKSSKNKGSTALQNIADQVFFKSKAEKSVSTPPKKKILQPAAVSKRRSCKSLLVCKWLKKRNERKQIKKLIEKWVRENELEERKKRYAPQQERNLFEWREISLLAQNHV